MERLRPSQHRRQGLVGYPRHVVLHLLRGEGRAGSLGVEAQAQRGRVLHLEPLAHQARPEPPRRSKLGDFLEQIVVGIEEERDARRYLFHLESGATGCLKVFQRIPQGEGNLLDRRRTRLANVVAADADAVPAWKVVPAVGEKICGDPQRGLRGVDVGAAGHVFLQHVVLDRPGQLFGGNTLLLPHGDVEAEENRCGGVDGHGGGDLLQRNPVQESLHVLQRIDGHPHPAHLSPGGGVVGVVSHLSGKVESHGKPGLPVPEKEFQPSIGLAG